MGTFNDTAEKLMDKLSDFADNKTEAKMLHLVNCVTMEVIAKVCCHNLFFAASSAVSFIESDKNCLSVFACFPDNAQVAFGVDLDLLNESSPFPKAVEICLKGMVYHVRDAFFVVRLHGKFVWRMCDETYWKLCKS